MGMKADDQRLPEARDLPFFINADELNSINSLPDIAVVVNNS